MLRSSLFLLATGCGRSLVGDWAGTCQNPANGELVSFEIDIDSDRRGVLEGDADMETMDNTGNTTETECEVIGGHDGKLVELEFDCDNDDNFELDLTLDGKVLIGDCGKDAELVLEQE
jgi:hypothetical protein